MTPEQKVALVQAVKDRHGLNCALAAVDLPKSTWYYHQNDKVDYEEKYGHLKPILETIAREYPEYGLPRIMTELRDVHDCPVNHKVVERLLRLWDLRILRGTRRRKPSGVYQAILEAGELANLVAQMEEIGLFEVIYTDFTEILYANGDKRAFLMPIIGHASKIAFGWAVGRVTTRPWHCEPGNGPRGRSRSWASLMRAWSCTTTEIRSTPVMDGRRSCS